jgi:hypothetical protein
LPLRYALQPEKSPTFMFSQSFVFPGCPANETIVQRLKGSVKN